MPSTIYKGDLAEVTLGHETGIVLTHGAWGGLKWGLTTSGDVSTITFDGSNGADNNTTGFFTANSALKYPVGLLAGTKIRIKGGGNYSSDDHTKGGVYTIVSNEGSTLKVTPALQTTPVAASLSFTFSGAATLNSQILLTDSAGNRKCYSAKGSGTSPTSDGNVDGDPNFNYDRGSSAANSATNLATSINHSTTHNGTLTAVASGAVLTITQATIGIAGETTVTLDVTSGVDFNGAVTGSVATSFASTSHSATGDELFIESLGTPTLDAAMTYNSNAQTSDERVLTDQFVGLAATVALPETKTEVFRSHVVGIGRDVVVQEPQSMKNEGGSLSSMMHSARWLYFALGNEAVKVPTNFHADNSGILDSGTNTNAIAMGDTYISFTNSADLSSSQISVGDIILVKDTDAVLTTYSDEAVTPIRWTGTQTRFHSSQRNEMRRVIAIDETSGYKRVYVDDPFCFDHAAKSATDSDSDGTNDGIQGIMRLAFDDAAVNGSPNFDTTAASYGNIDRRQSRAIWSMWHQPSFSIETSMRTRNVGSYGSEQTANAPDTANDSKQLTRVYKGCKVKDWQITADTDTEVKLDINFDALMCYTDTGRLENSNKGDRFTAHRMFENIANGPAERKKAGIAPNTEKPFFFYNGTITAFGTAIAQVTKFNLSGNNHTQSYLTVRGNPLQETRNTTGQSLEQIPFAGSRNPTIMAEGKVEYSCSMEIMPTDPLLWHEFRTNRQHNDTEPITLHLVKNGAGANREEVYIIIDDYILEEAPLQIPEDKSPILSELKILPKHVKVVAHDTLFHS